MSNNAVGTSIACPECEAYDRLRQQTIIHRICLRQMSPFRRHGQAMLVPTLEIDKPHIEILLGDDAGQIVLDVHDANGIEGPPANRKRTAVHDVQKRLPLRAAERIRAVGAHCEAVRMEERILRLPLRLRSGSAQNDTGRTWRTLCADAIRRTGVRGVQEAAPYSLYISPNLRPLVPVAQCLVPTAITARRRR